MTVYLVTSGEYSDYRVVCATATREAADEIVAFLNRAREDDARVEEYELVSSLQETKPQESWTVYVDASGKETSTDYEASIGQELHAKEYGHSFHPDSWDMTSAAMGRSSRGHDVALKIARDELARRKAEASGIG